MLGCRYSNMSRCISRHFASPFGSLDSRATQKVYRLCIWCAKSAYRWEVSSVWCLCEAVSCQQCSHQLVAIMPHVDRDEVMAPLLPFQRQLVSELLDEDGLCIMSAGLGWQKVLEAPDLPNTLVDMPDVLSLQHIEGCGRGRMYQGCT
jgi:hypothetical protein